MIKSTSFPILLTVFFAVFACAQSSEINARDNTVLSAEEIGNVPLIPREILFGNASKLTPKISPNGRTLAWIQPYDDVMNIWSAPIADIGASRPVTRFSDRDITSFEWSPDSSSVLFPRDKDGNEVTQLFSAKLGSSDIVQLSDGNDEIRWAIVSVSHTEENSLLVSANERDPENPDLFKIDLDTGQKQLVFKNVEGFARWFVTPDLNVTAGVKPIIGGGATIETLDSTPITKIPSGAFLGTYPVSVSLDRTTLFLVDSRNTNTATVSSISVSDGATRILYTSDLADADDVLVEHATGRPIAAAHVYARKEWSAIEQDYAKDFSVLQDTLRGEIAIISTTRDMSQWIIESNEPQAPGSYFLYNREDRSVRSLFSSRPDLEGQPLQEQEPVYIQSRDGLTLVSYLTRPSKVLEDDGPVPMVLHVHGGPWGRDRFGYSSWHQWLSNRGYAVLSVNFRGSTGFGRSFVEASQGEFAGKMHDDLIDAIDWAIEEGIADPDRIAITGGSYGGYAVLVGLSFTPDRFACGVDLVGISNLATLIEGFPDYWAPFLENTWYKYVGNPNDPDQREDMLSRSPVSRADAINRPLLIAQGENDPRVPKSESDQIANLLINRDVDVSYINFPDEGHGFVKSENRLAFYSVSEAFLAACLGGRAEAIENELSTSSIEFLHVGASLDRIRKQINDLKD